MACAFVFPFLFRIPSPPRRPSSSPPTPFFLSFRLNFFLPRLSQSHFFRQLPHWAPKRLLPQEPQMHYPLVGSERVKHLLLIGPVSPCLKGGGVQRVRRAVSKSLFASPL